MNESTHMTIVLLDPGDQNQETTPKARSISMATPASKHIAPPPSFDSTYSPFYNLLQSVQELVEEAVEEPAKPKFDHPFMYTPYINRTVYSLLGIIDDHDVETSKLPYYFYFPPKFDVYDPEIKPDWSSRAHYMGTPWPGNPNPYLTANGGLTEADKTRIKDFLMDQDPETVWK